MDGLSNRDLRLLRDALDPRLEAQPGELIAQPVLEEIARLIPSQNVTLQVMNYAHHKLELQRIAPTPDDLNPELRVIFWAGFWDSSCSHPQRTGDTSILWNQSAPPPTYRGDAVMREFAEGVGWIDEILVPLAAGDADDHRLLLSRKTGPKYTERDILLLTFVRAAVAERHARQVRQSSAGKQLTPRQVEILRLVAEGCTNRQIATTLSITEATARTHLANIYSKLGANSRTQALATAGILRSRG
jgi:DNA-binding CsgD family transcriptional regulator